MDYLLILLGLVLLVGGGEVLVRGAVTVAKTLDVPPMVIGLTLVGFGTSMPELVTSLQAAAVGAPGIAVGNVVGSNIANVLLIFGITALIAPVVVPRASFHRDSLFLIGSMVLAVGFALSGEFSRLAGIGLLAGLAVFLWMAFRANDPAAAEVLIHEADALPQARSSLPVAVLLFVVGLVVTILGARALVSGAVGLATQLGVSEAVIGLTIVAVGTSLPELVTSVIAARKGQSDVALGNIIGSNIFNILGILGLVAVVKPIGVPAQIAQIDIWVMAVATVLLVVVCRTGWRVSRREGAALLALYAAYLGWLAL